MSNDALFTLATPQLDHQHCPQSTAFPWSLTTDSNLHVHSTKSYEK
jgi:hypothetical protein